MPEHPDLPVEGVPSQLSLVTQAWVALAEGVVPGERSPVRVKRWDAPLPVSESVMDGRQAIESFVWTYSALLVHEGVWAPFAMPAGTLARLEVIAVHSTALTHHRNALVAWGFVEELAVLAKAVRWAVPTPTKRTSLGVPCSVDGCDGVYEVEVPLTGDGTAVQRKARFGKQAKAVCSVDDAHVMGATEVTP